MKRRRVRKEEEQEEEEGEEEEAEEEEGRFRLFCRDSNLVAAEQTPPAQDQALGANMSSATVLLWTHKAGKNSSGTCFPVEMEESSGGKWNLGLNTGQLLPIQSSYGSMLSNQMLPLPGLPALTTLTDRLSNLTLPRGKY